MGTKTGNSRDKLLGRGAAWLRIVVRKDDLYFTVTCRCLLNFASHDCISCLYITGGKSLAEAQDRGEEPSRIQWGYTQSRVSADKFTLCRHSVAAASLVFKFMVDRWHRHPEGPIPL